MACFWPWEQPCLHQDLEAVANTDDRFSSLNKLLKALTHRKAHAIAEQSSASKVVTEREAPRYCKNVKGIEVGVTRKKAIHVDPFCVTANQVEHRLRFVIAIDSKPKQHSDTGLHQTTPLSNRAFPSMLQPVHPQAMR